MSRLTLSFLFSTFCILPISVFSAPENDVVTLEAPLETAAESNAPAAEANVAETVPETGVATEEPAASAATEVVVPADTVAGDTVPSSVGSATESTVENVPVVDADKAVSVPAIEETASPGAVSGEALVSEPVEDKLDKAVPAATEAVDESTTVTGVVAENAEFGELDMSEVNPLKASGLEFFAGVSLMNFDYTEFGTDGGWLDDENGVLPGILLGGTLYWTHWYASLELDYFSGEVDYRGQTQSLTPAFSGLPINSTSDADIFDTTAIVGYQFSSLSMYGGLGYYFWRRNIRPTTTNSGLSVAGVLEFYSWTYALLGINAPLFSKEDSRISLDIRATRMLQAEMEVDFLGFQGYDNANLNLGEDWGLRLALPWTFRLSASDNNTMLTIEPYYVRWNLNRSAVTELTVDGAGIGLGVVEPQSETRNFGISLYFRYLM